MGNKKIFKYPFEVGGEIEIWMPEGAVLLTVQTVQAQNEPPCIWAIVDPAKPLETRQFRLFDTGQPIDMNLEKSKYIGTFQLYKGEFIRHLFEVLKAAERKEG